MDVNENENVLPEIKLIRFDNPELVTSKPISKKAIQGKYSNSVQKSCTNVLKLKKAAAEEISSNKVLNYILPVREWGKNGSFWRQEISKKPATKTDLTNLRDKFDTYLEQYQVKNVGLCPIKRELYSQCFNEIIRQETLQCKERGLMLIHIRDEMNMTIDSYEKLYESAVAYGLRKTLMREQMASDAMESANRLRVENEVLKAEIEKTIGMTEQWEREGSKALEVEKESHAQKLSALKRNLEEKKAQVKKSITDCTKNINALRIPPRIKPSNP